MLRLALCCQFKEAPIKFRTTTARYAKSLENPLDYLSEIIHHNCQSLIQAIQYCSDHGIGSFRINSQLFPLYTHPELGYALEDLPDHQKIQKTLKEAKALAKKNNIRLTFHPDQFVVLNSPKEEVVAHSIDELEYHGIMAQLVGADVINIHGGGAYGNKPAALERFKQNFKKLSKRVQKRLTLENDDKVFTPEDLLPVCIALHIPFVYDVHHHRCLPDGLTIAQATKAALKTWNREPLFHISSPKEGWGGKRPQLHHDFIDPEDFPKDWQKIPSLTVDVEAKGKEIAVLKLLPKQ